MASTGEGWAIHVSSTVGFEVRREGTRGAEESGSRATEAKNEEMDGEGGPGGGG